MKKMLCLVVAIVMMISAVPALAYEELAMGSKGEEVIKLQERLNAFGYSVGTADGDYGNKTLNAIEQLATGRRFSILISSNTRSNFFILKILLLFFLSIKRRLLQCSGLHNPPSWDRFQRTTYAYTYTGSCKPWKASSAGYRWEGLLREEG